MNCQLRCLLTLVAISGLRAREAATQTNDWSSFSAGVSIGRIGSAKLWSIDNQSVRSDTPRPPAVFALRRGTPADETLAVQLSYYRSPHVGFAAELAYLGLANSDGCTLVSDDGDPYLAAACASFKNAAAGSGAVSARIGLVLRPSIRSVVQPHFELLAGITSVVNSTVAMTSTYAINHSPSTATTGIAPGPRRRSVLGCRVPRIRDFRSGSTRAAP
jgi:hypothetical protein